MTGWMMILLVAVSVFCIAGTTLTVIAAGKQAKADAETVRRLDSSVRGMLDAAHELKQWAAKK